MALQTRVMGTVRVRATVGKDGRVKQAAAVSGPTMLRQAAVDAVRRWIYAPAMLNGELVESETQADVIFGQR
jgi:protein TonB